MTDMLLEDLQHCQPDDVSPHQRFQSSLRFHRIGFGMVRTLESRLTDSLLCVLVQVKDMVGPAETYLHVYGVLVRAADETCSFCCTPLYL